MKQIFSHTHALRAAAVLGLTGMLGGIATTTPAHAQEDYRSYQERDHIRHDVNDIRRDQDRLRDLYRRRDNEVRRRDWADVHALDRQISDLKWHIDHDRQDVRRDFERARNDRDRNYNRDYDRNHNTDRDRYRPQNSDFNRTRYKDDYRVRDDH